MELLLDKLHCSYCNLLIAENGVVLVESITFRMFKEQTEYFCSRPCLDNFKPDEGVNHECTSKSS